MQQFAVYGRRFTGTLALTLACLSGLAQDNPSAGFPPASAAPSSGRPTDSNSQTSSIPTGPKARTAPTSTALTKNSAVVDEIVKMTQAGVSKEVIRAYIEHAPIRSLPGAAEVIALKAQGVPDELTVVFVKRGAELMAQADQPGSNGGVPTSVAPARAYRDRGQLDPGSYEFWWYHYAYPRALASANETLLSSYAPIAPYSYGYLPPLPFPPQPSPRSFRLR